MIKKRTFLYEKKRKLTKTIGHIFKICYQRNQTYGCYRLVKNTSKITMEKNYYSKIQKNFKKDKTHKYYK